MWLDVARRSLFRWKLARLRCSVNADGGDWSRLRDCLGVESSIVSSEAGLSHSQKALDRELSQVAEDVSKCAGKNNV